MLPRCEKVHITMKRLVNLLYGIGLRLLNVGEARETDLEGMPSTEASRTMNQITCCLILRMERKALEIEVQDGKFVYRQSGKLVDTKGEPEDAK
ncbi:hypothetical protein FEM48_Zijuj12G0076900 [Ziziphus jujuba var. spinosa]|uniref:Uncharacterized protein n=1 Tax=Ziziphus jujuba var. spinosa TaxID=714518 RepID=A0A978UC14_ZIZJJ|nr:hypothetical protein FEM48_Zijuj12G0076900 [Ziziphus jujuba var. spinosa]